MLFVFGFRILQVLDLVLALRQLVFILFVRFQDLETLLVLVSGRSGRRGSSGEEENEGDLDENDEQKPFTVMKANLGFDQMEGISEFLECLPRGRILRWQHYYG